MAHHRIIITHPRVNKHYDASGADMDNIISALNAYSSSPSWLSPSMTWVEYGTGSQSPSGGSGDTITFVNNDLSLEWDGYASDLQAIITALQVTGTGNSALIASLQGIQ